MAPLSPHLAEMEEKRQHLPPHALPLCRLFLSRLPLSLSLSPSLICLLALLPPLLPLCYSLPPKVSREGRGWGLPAPGFNSFLALSRLSPSRSAWVLGAAWGALLAPLEVLEVPAGVAVGWKQPQAPCQELRAALAPSPRHLHPGTHGCAAPCATGTERSWAGCPRRVPAALSIVMLQVRGGVTVSAAPLSHPCPILGKGEGVWEPWGGGRAPQPPARARRLCPSPKRGQILTRSGTWVAPRSAAASQRRWFCSHRPTGTSVLRGDGSELAALLLPRTGRGLHLGCRVAHPIVPRNHFFVP